MSSKPNGSVAVLRESPLVGVDFSALGLPERVLCLAEVPFLTHINLRGDPANKSFVSAVESVIKVSLPLHAGTVTLAPTTTVVWCGPDEWLIIVSEDSQPCLADELSDVVRSMRSQVTDISGGNTIIDIRGERARDLLKKASTLDVHASVFQVGQSALSTFAHAQAAIYQYDSAPGYRVVIRRSYADYVAHWLIAAAKEFSLGQPMR